VSIYRVVLCYPLFLLYNNNYYYYYYYYHHHHCCCCCCYDDYGAWYCSWLRHYPTSQKVMGSIPDGVFGIFHLLNPSGCSVGPGVDSTT